LEDLLEKAVHIPAKAAIPVDSPVFKAVELSQAGFSLLHPAQDMPP
jgi:hypothetical protein